LGGRTLGLARIAKQLTLKWKKPPGGGEKPIAFPIPHNNACRL
jgi:hypothetical protein